MELDELTAKMHAFVNEKGWYSPESPRPQTARNLAASLAIESAEVLALFQWTDKEPPADDLAMELADVALYLLQLASISGVNLEKAVLEKLSKNYQRHWE